MNIKKIIFYLLICCFLGKISHSQDTIKILKNSISIDGFYIVDYNQSQLFTNYNVRGIMLNYSRVIFNKEIHSAKLQIGIGWFLENLGEAEGLLPATNTNIYLKYLLGSKKHQGSIGIGLDYILYYFDIYFLFPCGYTFNINKNFSVNFTCAPVLWYYYDKYDGDNSSVSKDWIWNDNIKEIWLNLGFSYNF